MKRVLFLCVAIGALAGAGTAGADGLPVLGIDVGGTGVATSSGDARFVTIPAGQNTVVARIDTHTGHVLSSRMLTGTFTIPAVAYDASAGGLSADGKHLVLIEPRTGFPRARTKLLVLDTSHLWFGSAATIELKGDFSFDAISPRGSYAYLIQYTKPTDPTRYLVRALDLKTDRLGPKPVVDPRERSVKMRGNPLTRSTSPDGRWAYTLYDGAGAVPFVHALDTSTRTARCIDLPMLRNSNVLWSLRMRVDAPAGTLTVVNGKTSVVNIDTRTFRPSVPSTPSPRAPARPTGGFPWLVVALAILGALAAAAAPAVMARVLTRPGRSPARAS